MSTPTAPSPLHALTERIEGLDALDEPGRKIGKQVRGALDPGTVKDLLSGTWLGHAIHPLLTDVVIGSFLSATILDLVGGRDGEDGARKLIGVGLLAYGPTAATGVSDWADSEPASDAIRRVGLVHAWTNGTAFTLYAASLKARRKGRRGLGVLLGLGGAAALGAGGYLGAHMTYQQGVGVDQTTFDTGPEDWTAVAGAGEVAEGAPAAGVAGETPVVLVRSAGRLRAPHDRCSHRGDSLAAGEVDGDAIVCTCHGSRFSLDDGTVLRGPATADQPVFDVREQGATIEVRLRED
jgi:nitrite reductase/ring-hydroxylating ferredoxin subunit/uncharacterized membrane protein